MEVLRKLFSEIKLLGDFIREMDSSEHLTEVLVTENDTDRYIRKRNSIYEIIVMCPVMGGSNTGRIQILVLTNCPGNWY